MSDPLQIRLRLKNILKSSTFNVSEYTSNTIKRTTEYLVGDRIKLIPYLGVTYRCIGRGITNNTTPSYRGLNPIKDGTSVWIEDSDFYDLSIKGALDVFSNHLPFVHRSVLLGRESGVYTLPDEWVNECSVITKIEYPLEQIPSTYLTNDQFEVYQSDAESYKLIIHTPISVADSCGLYFTLPRTPISIPENYIEAFVWLCAGLALAKMASSYIMSTDSSISIDTVDYKDKMSLFRNQSKYFIDLYKEWMGISKKGYLPAAVVLNLPLITYPSGLRRLTH